MKQDDDDHHVLDECATSILMLQNPEIHSQRTFNLRKKQREAGVEFMNLRPEQKGLLPVTFMHHVSKVVEGKMAFYRVRICRTCSGLPTLIELGSFADVESALLVNDAHEIQNGRTKQLHLLVKGDCSFFHMLSVRCRGSSYDMPLSQVLGARILKSNKRKSMDDEEEEMPTAIPPVSEQISSLTIPKPPSQSMQDDLDHSSSRELTTSTTLSISPPLSEDHRIGRRRVARSVSMFNNSLRVQFLSSFGFESIWGIVGGAEAVRDLIGVLFLCINERLLHHAEQGVEDLSSLINVIRFSSTSCSTLLALLASLLSGATTVLLQPICTRLKALIPKDTAPLTNDLRAALLAAISEIKDPLSFSVSEAFEKCYQLLWYTMITRLSNACGLSY